MKHMDALKTKQEQAVRNIFAVLPTGFGKSRIYQAFSLLKSCENTGATLITCNIIAPLTSIIEDQLADLRLRGFRAAAYLFEVKLNWKNAGWKLYYAQLRKFLRRSLLAC